MTAGTATASRRDAFFRAIIWRFRHDEQELPAGRQEIAYWLKTAEEWYANFHTEQERAREVPGERLAPEKAKAGFALIHQILGRTKDDSG